MPTGTVQAGGAISAAFPAVARQIMLIVNLGIAGRHDYRPDALRHAEGIPLDRRVIEVNRALWWFLPSLPLSS